MAFGRKHLGTGWGGRRTGSGPKPKPKAPPSGLIVFQGGMDRALLEPPALLPEAQHGCWRQWAPLALARRTLTAETVPAFTLLCELEVKRRAIATVLETGEPSPAGLRIFAQFAKQVEGLMGRFCLAPFGKPVVSDKPKAAANPWGAFGGQGGKP